MKTILLLAAALFLAVSAQAQPTTFQQRVQTALPQPLPILPGQMPPGAQSSAVKKEPANYLIRVEWKEPKAEKKFLEVLTTEGQFNLDTIQKTSVKINNNDIPVTLKFSGTLRNITDEKGRLELFLGRTIPYVTGSYGNGNSSYSQLSVGLNSTFIVKFGKPLVIQNDENGEISVLVTRMTD